MAHSILRKFLLDDAARGEDTTFVISAPMLKNLKRAYEKGGLHFITTFSCDQKKEKDPRLQKPKSKGWGTPARKDSFTIIVAS